MSALERRIRALEEGHRDRSQLLSHPSLVKLVEQVAAEEGWTPAEFMVIVAEMIDEIGPPYTLEHLAEALETGERDEDHDFDSDADPLVSC